MGYIVLVIMMPIKIMNVVVRHRRLCLTISGNGIDDIFWELCGLVGFSMSVTDRENARLYEYFMRLLTGFFRHMDGISRISGCLF